jgi:multidrug efflux system outer membrane protein
VRKLLALLLAGAALTGCTLEPRYARPAPAVPQAWPKGPAYPVQTAQALPSVTYRDVFKDPRLQALIVRALANNQNLAQAIANVEIARDQFRVQRAAVFPVLDAVTSGTETKTQVGATTANGTVTNNHLTVRKYTADLSAAWTIDLFGKFTSLSHEALEQYFASEAGASAARLTLVANLADAYLTLGADRSLLVIAQETLAASQKTVDLTRARVSGGVAPATDLMQALTLLDQARSDVASFTTQVAQDRNAIDLLVGAPVADADLPSSIETVDGLLADVPPGLDSQVLLRRPDVAQAEYRLRAANAQIGAARAAFFPTISLTGAAGYASGALGRIFAGGDFTWTATGTAAEPLFAGGANIAGLGVARGEQKLALAQYQSAIQAAFRDVANALARRGTIDEQLAAQTDLTTAAQRSYDLELARYREGIDPYLNTLDAQRTLYSARRTLAATRLTRAQNLVALYQSLGGDQLVEMKKDVRWGIGLP